MVQAADNPGKWTDWDHALDAVQKYLDNGEAIVRKRRSERTDREQIKLEDHFIKNYHRVIEKDFWKELDWVSLRKELIRLRGETPDITYAPCYRGCPPPEGGPESTSAANGTVPACRSSRERPRPCRH